MSSSPGLSEGIGGVLARASSSSLHEVSALDETI